MVEPLLPKRHKQGDLFICDFGEVIPKSDIASMEHPLFSLSTKADTAIRDYEHNGNTVTITPSVLGLATIHDKDILIYCISQLMAGINKGDEPSRKICFKAHDLLVTTNRQTSGEGYKLLRKAFDRLRGTSITTNIKTDKKEIVEGFGIIDSYKIVVEDNKTNRMVELEITLSEWLYNSVLGQEVLSINHDYFRLRKPIERRIYEIARKHCAQKNEWLIGIKKLHKKSGSTSSLKKFKEALNYIVKFGHLPDYKISIEGDNVIFEYIGSIAISHDEKLLYLKSETYETGRKILGRHFDVYAIESEWLEHWNKTGCPDLKTSDGAFIAFCKNKVSIL